MPRIIPSIASAPTLEMSSFIKKLGNRGTLHLDIEDGNFIPNITFGIKTVREICAAVDMPLNAHLMVNNPLNYIASLAECGVSEIAAHIESSPYPMQVLNYIKSFGIKAGLAMNLVTPLNTAAPFWDDMDFLLLMTSEEDGLGQLFCKRAPERIRNARAMLLSGKALWVDGGVGEEQLAVVCDSGADTIVMGRAIAMAKNPIELIEKFESYGGA